MSGTLNNFIVGIGLDFDLKGAKEAKSQIDSIKRVALQAGGAIAGAFGAKAITMDVSSRVSALSRLSEVYGSTAQEISAMGMAMEREGGSIDSFISQMTSLEKTRSRMLVGDFSFIPDGAMAGANVAEIINAKDSIEAIKNLADQFPDLSKQQRINVASVFGFDDAMIRLLSKGGEHLDKQIKRMSDMRMINKELEASSIELQTQWADTWDNMYGVVDRAGSKMIPKVAEMLSGINAEFDKNRESINSSIDETFAFFFKAIDFSKMIEDVPGSETPAINLRSPEVKADIEKLGRYFNSFMSGLTIAPWKVEDEAAMPDSLNGATANASGSAMWAGDFVSPVMNAQWNSQGSASQIVNQAPVVKEKFEPTVNVYIGDKELKQVVIDVIDQEDEQMLQDITSPLIN